MLLGANLNLLIVAHDMFMVSVCSTTPRYVTRIDTSLMLWRHGLNAGRESGSLHFLVFIQNYVVQKGSSHWSVVMNLHLRYTDTSWTTTSYVRVIRKAVKFHPILHGVWYEYARSLVFECEMQLDPRINGLIGWVNYEWLLVFLLVSHALL